MALLLAGSSNPFVAASIVSVVMATLLVIARSGLLPCSDEGGVFGDLPVLVLSALIAMAGFFVGLLLPSAIAALLGFMLVGAGVSNIAPILFTLTGRTKRMPANLAVASVLTVGYLGIIAGPAAIGLIAHATSLQTAFSLLCAAMVIIAISSRSVFHRV